MVDKPNNFALSNGNGPCEAFGVWSLPTVRIAMEKDACVATTLTLKLR